MLLNDCPNSFEELPADVDVIRLVPRNNDFIPEGARLPTRKAFEPTKDDKEEAATRGRAVAVSVWDTRRSTLQHVRAIRGSSRPNRAYAVSTNDLQRVAAEHKAMRLRGVTDPIRDSKMPGAFGHCGVEGCDRPQNADKLTHKAMLDDLALACNPLEE